MLDDVKGFDNVILGLMVKVPVPDKLSLKV